ncbi:MAG: hypothetical protein ACREXY_20275, partial [Gammaproteobacteria bacterium]
SAASPSIPRTSWPNLKVSLIAIERGVEDIQTAGRGPHRARGRRHARAVVSYNHGSGRAD